MEKNREKGQALLIVVLVMVVALTVGLSIASRSITNLRTSTDEANSQKALAAAEAGIEQAIKSNSTASGNFSGGTTYSTNITQVSGTSFLVNGGNPVLQDNGADVWFSTYPTYANPWTGSLVIQWGATANSCSEAAIEVVVISGSKQSPQSAHYVFDPCQTRTGTNHFTVAPLNKTTISGKDLYYQSTINVVSGLLGRIVPLYYNSPIGLTASTALPSQGSVVTSTGISGGTQRKVNVFQGYPQIPSEFFLYSLFSPVTP